MKKVLLMAVVTLMATMCAKAQNEEGEFTIMPKGGYSLVSLASYPDAKFMSGYVAGIEFEYVVNDNVGLVAGLHYSAQGVKDNAFDLKYMLGYTNVPIMIQYYPVKGLALKAGAQLGFLTSKKAKENGVQVDIDKLEAFFEVDAGFRKFDIAIPLGISYEYANFVIDARYNLGLIGIVKGYDKTMRNSVFQFSLGYKIPFSN
jgi:hypothetical protein